MKVEITDIPNVIADNTIGNKVLLMNQLISHFAPLFNEEIDRKKRQLDDNKADIKKLKSEVGQVRQNLKLLQTEFKKEELKFECIKEIKYLSNLDVIYGSNKQIIRKMLNSLDEATPDDLIENMTILRRIVDEKLKKNK